jgi:hypothetical protein
LYTPANFSIIIPDCAPIYATDRWYFFEPISLEEAWTSSRNRTICMYRQQGNMPKLIGHFCLRDPASNAIGPRVQTHGQAVPVHSILPDIITDDARPAVCLAGGRDQIFLKIEMGGQVYGYWPLSVSD